MKTGPFKCLNTRDTGQFRTTEQTGGGYGVFSLNPVALIGGHDPAFAIFLPDNFLCQRLKQRLAVQIEFFRDDDGNVTSARHSQGIAKFNAPRVKERVAVELPEEVLERFVGNYRYAIGATLTIRRDGSKLLAKLTGQPEMEVFTESDSTLFWKIVNAQLKFSFDDDGKFVDATHQQSGRNIAVTKVD